MTRGALGWLAGLYYGRESAHATVQFHFFDGYNLGFWFPQIPPPCRHSADPALFGFDEYNNFDQIKDSRALFRTWPRAVAPGYAACRLRYTKDKITMKQLLCAGRRLERCRSVGLRAPYIDAATWWTQTIPSLPPGPRPTAFFQQGLGLRDSASTPARQGRQ